MEPRLKVGEVINGTISTLIENKEAVIAYLAIFTLLGTFFQWGAVQAFGWSSGELDDSSWVLELFGIGAGIGGILLAILTVIGQYLLWESMLRRIDLMPGDDRRRILAFFGQAILTGIGVGIGFVLLVVPGLIFTARWAAAPAYLIAEKQGVIDAMGSSWDELKGTTTPVVLAILAAAIVILFAYVAIEFLTDGGGEGVGIGLGESLFTQLISHIATVLSAGLGVFLFTSLHGPSRALSKVFE